MRIVKRTAKGPAEDKTKSGDSVWVCRCGLSKNPQGLCDGSHKKVADEQEEKVFCYEEDGTRKECSCDCDCCRE